MELIKIPFSSIERTRGCIKAPDEIVKQLNETFLDESFNDKEIIIEEIKVNLNNIEETFYNIEKNIKENALIIGGDHSITYPCFKATNNEALVVFDAHADMQPSTNTACNEDWLRKLIQDDIVKAENVFLCCVRNIHKTEFDFLKENKIKFWTSKQVYDLNIHEFSDVLMENIRSFKSIYLSIDLDVLDPAFAPAVSYPEAGGISTRELLYILQRLKLLKNIKNIDVVECNPTKDFNDITTRVAAKIIKEMIQ